MERETRARGRVEVGDADPACEAGGASENDGMSRRVRGPPIFLKDVFRKRNQFSGKREIFKRDLCIERRTSGRRDKAVV